MIRNYCDLNVNTCDNCNETVTVLWRDKEHWLLCPKCWPLYHIVGESEQHMINLYLVTLKEL